MYTITSAQLVRRFISSTLYTAVLHSITSCKVSDSQNASKTATVSDHNFIKSLNTINDKPNSVLISITYWNGWQVILRDLSSRKYKAFVWKVSVFEESKSSPILKESMIKEIYEHLVPLDNVYQTASLDYTQVLDHNKSWKMMNMVSAFLPTPSLMRIKLGGRVRPIWVLSYRMYPDLGPVGVFADDGTILKSVKLSLDGLRERHWWE